MVHKSGHHFDLVNWWLDAQPETVAGMGRLAFYGDENGKRHGWARNYERARGSAEAKDDPFAINLEDDETLTVQKLGEKRGEIQRTVEGCGYNKEQERPLGRDKGR